MTGKVRNLGTIGIEYRNEDRPAIIDLCLEPARIVP
jgi:hypothetical protein